MKSKLFKIMNEINSFTSLRELISTMVEEYICNNAIEIKATECRLDDRCYKVYISQEFIAVKKEYVSSLNYYGGFEYVEKEYVSNLDEYIFYSSEDSRVMEHIEWFLQENPNAFDDDFFEEENDEEEISS